MSGHGLGHASRTLEVINTIGRQTGAPPIVVRTSAPAWFFEDGATSRIDVQSVETDTGMVQIDSLTLDEDETARRAARFYDDFDRRVALEADVLRAITARAVVGDIPPLAFAAAVRAGVPSIAFGNFTWDWIYEIYPSFERLAPGVVARIRDAYARATCTLRLPLHGGFDGMAAIEDLPLVARRSGRDPRLTREMLHLPPDEPIVLASFGGFGLKLSYDDIARENDITLLVTDHETGIPGDGVPAGRVRQVGRRAITSRGLRYEDLVAAADVVVSKPGYGIVSECIANDTALLFTSRGRFAEQDVFLREMPRVLRCASITPHDLRAGRWRRAILSLLNQPDAPDRLAVNGADVAAGRILEIYK